MTGTDAPLEQGDEAGFSLFEVLIATFIFTVISLVVFDIMGWVSADEVRIQNTAASSEQLALAFTQLDGEIRYAADINTPGSDLGSWWVELESDYPAASGGQKLCTQLQYTTLGVLEQRSWALSAGVPPLAGASWQVLATGLANAPAADPFTLTTYADPSVPWRLAFSLTASSGAGVTATSSQSSFTLTALDTARTTTGTTASSSNVCGGMP